MNHILQVIEAVCRRWRVEAFWVGGTVRDRLLGRESHDWDIVTPHAGKVARAVARRLSATCITLDEQYRIYRIIPPSSKDLTLDFAELQGKALRQDLARRDFTLNAMAMPLRSVRVIDPFGGQRDLKRRIVRVVSRKAFQKDPLRLLRAFRMAAQFDLTIEPQTARWITADSSALSRRAPSRPVARERVREELLRFLSQPACAKSLWDMDRSGLLTVILPDLEAGRRVGLTYYGKGGVVKHHLQSVENVEWLLDRLERRIGGTDDRRRPAGPPARTLQFMTLEIADKVEGYLRQPIGGYPHAAYLKLAALLHDLGKPATAQVIKGRLRFFGHEDVGADLVGRLLGSLRFSRQETLKLRSWVRNHMRLGNLASAPAMTEKAMARYFRDLGEDGVGMLIVSLGDHYCYLARSKWGKVKDPVERTAQRLLQAYYEKRDSVLPPKLINGHLLMKKLRLKSGPLIGKLLEAVRDAQAEGKVKTVEEALGCAKRLLQ